MKEQNNNLIPILFIVAILILAGAIIYAVVANKGGTVNTASTLDNHGHAMGGAAKGPISTFDGMIGKPTPNFELRDRDGKIYTPENLKGKNVVLFFNEGLMCYPACWNQIAAFGKDNRFAQQNTVVLSVVTDSKEDWQNAIVKMPELAAATVVFDVGAVNSQNFHMLTTASSMHYGALPGHTYMLIDKGGIVRHVYDDPNMQLHDDQLIEEIKKI